MRIELDTLIELIVRETVRELAKLGVDIDGASSAVPAHQPAPSCGCGSTRSGATGSASASQADTGADAAAVRVKVDLSRYRTPVLLESHVLALDERIREIEIPTGTVISPGARDAIKHRRMRVIGACAASLANKAQQ